MQALLTTEQAVEKITCHACPYCKSLRCRGVTFASGVVVLTDTRDVIWFPVPSVPIVPSVPGAMRGSPGTPFGATLGRLPGNTWQPFLGTLGTLMNGNQVMCVHSLSSSEGNCPRGCRRANCSRGCRSFRCPQSLDNNSVQRKLCVLCLCKLLGEKCTVLFAGTVFKEATVHWFIQLQVFGKLFLH